MCRCLIPNNAATGCISKQGLWHVPAAQVAENRILRIVQGKRVVCVQSVHCEADAQVVAQQSQNPNVAHAQEAKGELSTQRRGEHHCSPGAAIVCSIWGSVGSEWKNARTRRNAEHHPMGQLCRVGVEQCGSRNNVGDVRARTAQSQRVPPWTQQPREPGAEGHIF